MTERQRSRPRSPRIARLTNVADCQAFYGRLDSLLHQDPRYVLNLGYQGVQIAKEAEDPTLLAGMSFAVGAASYLLSDLAVAQRYCWEAAKLYRRVGSVQGQVHTLLIFVDTFLRLGVFATALREAKKLVETAQKLSQPLEHARALMCLGNVYHHLDKYEDASRLYGRARRVLIGTRGSGPYAARIQKTLHTIDFNRANALTFIGRTAKAEALYASCLEYYERLELKQPVANVKFNQCCLFVKTGRWQVAYDTLKTLHGEFVDIGNLRGAALVNLESANLHLSLNLNQKAHLFATEAARELRKLNCQGELAKARTICGTVHERSGEFDQAKREFAVAGQDFRAVGNRVWEALCILKIGFIALGAQEFAAAALSARKARRLVSKMNVPLVRAQAWELEAQSLLATRKYAQALEASRKALSYVSRAPSPSLPEVVWRTRGRILLRLGRRTSGIQALKKSAASIERSRFYLTNDDLLISFQRNHTGVFFDIVRVCLQSARLRDVEEAFYHAGRAKSAVLAEFAERNGRSNYSFNNNRRLRHELNSVYNSMIELGAKPGPHHRQGFRQLSELARRIESKISDSGLSLERSSSGQSRVGAAQLSVSQIRERMEKSATLLEYFVLDKELTAFVLTRNKLDVVHDFASAEQVYGAIARLRFRVERLARAADVTREETGLKLALTDLHRLLMQPVAPLFGSGPLYVVPNGPLHDIPFHALFNGTRYLMDEREVSILPNRALLGWKPRKLLNPSGPVAFGVAGSGIPAVANELRAVRAMLPKTRLRQGGKATIEEFFRTVPRAPLIHIASHAMFRSDNPMYSALQLADGWISSWEIAQLRVQARLAVLSACETGRSKRESGDEILGLARGFFAAGVPTLLLSLWRVEDRRTAELMKKFYFHLKCALGVRSALHRAIQELRESYSNPYYWAPFVIVGRPQTRLARVHME